MGAPIPAGLIRSFRQYEREAPIPAGPMTTPAVPSAHVRSHSRRTNRNRGRGHQRPVASTPVPSRLSDLVLSGLTIAGTGVLLFLMIVWIVQGIPPGGNCHR